MDPRIPDKQYFRIGEVATIAGVVPYVLRFWETEFPQLRPGKSSSGQRLYARRDVALVLRIRDLLHGEKFTIKGARRALRDPEERGAPSPRTVGLLDQIRKEVEDLLRLVGE